MKRFLKILLFLPLALLSLFLIAVTCFEQSLPDFLLTHLLEKASSESLLWCADEVSFRFPRGIRVRGLRLLDRTAAQARPILSADEIDVRLTFSRLPWSLERLVKHVTVRRFRYSRLPEGYYIPDSIEFPGRPDFKEKNEPLEFSFPHFKAFGVTLEEPDILAIRPRRVEIGRVESNGTRLKLDEITLHWADRDVPMSLDGDLLVDANLQCVRGQVHGQARQAHIRPMLCAIDITNALPYIDGFTGVTAPVDAGCRFDVNLRNNDLGIHLDLHPSGGAYHGVPLKRADGPVDVRVFVRDTYQNARITVGPLVAEMPDGGSMRGSVVYENTNDVGYVAFDVISSTSLSNALAIADVMRDGTLDCLQPTSTPKITLNGLLAVDPHHAATNDLRGTLAFARGTFFTIPLLNAYVAFHVKGTDVTFSHARAAAPHGGTLSGDGLIRVPEFRQDLASFRTHVRMAEVPLADLAEVFDLELGDRRGAVDAEFDLAGPLDGNLVARLSGNGRVKISQGHLSRLPVFMGLTDYLAKNVPGIGRFVDQSDAELTYSITNGTIAIPDLKIDGDVFSLRGSGSYDMRADKLDFTVRGQFFKNESLLEKITSPINWTFSKLLMEFKVFCPLARPDWKYVNILNRLMDGAEKAEQLVLPDDEEKEKTDATPGK